MSPVPLTPEEWIELNAVLPDVSVLCSRVRTWPYMEYILGLDIEKVSHVRLSQVCFRDAANCLANARYALGQALGVRQYFLSQSTSERDTNHVLADIRSRFYADYVPLLLYSTAEHTRLGILEMLGLKSSLDKYRSRHDYKLKRTLNALEDLYSGNPITVATKIFDASGERRRIWEYRDKWVHDQPMRVETVLYNPPRRDFVVQKTEDDPLGGILIGAETSVDFQWSELSDLLKAAVQVTADFLNICAPEWEQFHSQVEVDYRSIWENNDETKND